MRLGTALVFCCSVTVVGVQGCSVLLDTKSLTDGDNPTGGGGELRGGSSTGGAISGSAVGGTPTAAGGVSSGAGGTGAGGTGAGAAGGGAGGTGIIIVAVGGDPTVGGGTTTCSSDAVESCDGLDNDCDPSTPDVCPRNCLGIAHGGSGYMACNLEIGFAEAEVVCEASQMKLVKIDDASENSFVRAVAKVTSPYVWIGASDPTDSEVYEWIDGTVVYDKGSTPRGVYSNFLAGQPERLTKRACAQMEVHSGGWSSTPCTDTQQFVCESY